MNKNAEWEENFNFFKEFVHKKNTITRYTGYSRMKITRKTSKFISRIGIVTEI